jgi:hypothetical protein
VLLNAFNAIREGVYGSEVGGLQDSTILDYRLVVFGDFSPYVMVRCVDDKWAVAEAERWHGCVDVSRELALYLCPYYGWGRFPVEADVLIKQTESQPARHVVVAVPFSFTEAVAFQTPAESA